MPRHTYSTVPPPPVTGRFVVVGDLQRTSGAEVWRPSNTRERERLVLGIEGEKPDLVVLLGDLVFCGSSEADWQDFDTLLAPIAALGIPALPILGNHEFWLTGVPALGRFRARFPDLQGARWYLRVYGPLALVALDSNRRWLTPAERRAQGEFLVSELARLDAEPEVRGILILVHHPPFTNSVWTADDRWVKQELVPRIAASRKVLAVLSGHVHSYERYERDGLTFVVAGGGGPRVKLSTGGRRRHLDDRVEGPAVRAFHYLVGTLGEEGLAFETLGFHSGDPEFTTLDRFALPFRAQNR